MELSDHHLSYRTLRRLQMKKRTHMDTTNWFTEPMDICYTRLENQEVEMRPHVRRRIHHHGGERIGEASNPGPSGPLKKKTVGKTSNVRHLLYCECTMCHNVSKCTTPHVHNYKTGAEGRILRKNKGAREQRADQGKPKPQCRAYKCHDLNCTAAEHRHFPFKTKFQEDGDFFVCSATDADHNQNNVEEEEFFDKFQEALDLSDVSSGPQECDDEKIDDLSPSDILPPLVPPLLRREYTMLTPPSAYENEHKHGDGPHAEEPLESRKSEPSDEPRLAGTESESSELEDIAPLPLTTPSKTPQRLHVSKLPKILRDVSGCRSKFFSILPPVDEKDNYDADDEKSPKTPSYAWSPPPEAHIWRAPPRRARTGALRSRRKKGLGDLQTIGVSTVARHKHIRELQDSHLPPGLRMVLLYNNALVKKRRMYVSEWLFNRKKAREEQPLIPWRTVYQFIEDVCTGHSSVQRIYEQDATFRAYNLLVDSSVTVGRSGEVRDQLKQEFVYDLLGDKYNSVSRAVIHVELFEHLMSHPEILDRPALSADNKLRTTLFYSLGAAATKWAKDNVDNPYIAALSHAVRSDTLTYVFQQKYLEGLRRLKAIPNVEVKVDRPLNSLTPAPKTARRGAM